MQDMQGMQGMQGMEGLYGDIQFQANLRAWQEFHSPPRVFPWGGEYLTEGTRQGSPLKTQRKCCFPGARDTLQNQWFPL